jgi:predicted exporter
MRRPFPWVPVVLVAVTIASAWLTVARLRLSSDLSTLFPESGDAAALVRWNGAFGGRDPALVLVRGDVPDDVAAVADAIAAALRHDGAVERVIVGVPALTALRDPTLAWAYAGPRARARLAELV